MKNQKGISLILLLLIVIVVFLCIFVFKTIFNNNTENTNNNSTTNINTESQNSSNIVGSWQSGAFIYTFNADGTATLTGTGINTQQFTYKIKSNKISLTNKETNGSLEMEYSIKDDNLYIGNVIYTKVK